MLNQKIKEKITRNPISLEKYGLNDLAWTQEAAKKLIHDIKEDEIGILGGDIYELTEDCLIPVYDNWLCEKNKKESLNDYYLRSKVESLNYIENYEVSSKKMLFLR
ncbi:MAG: Imm40 family immunity protein [Chlamydiales bacterium]|nr:Imm40 family immunity protein [Chlamydiales bacterium]